MPYVIAEKNDTIANGIGNVSALHVGDLQIIADNSSTDTNGVESGLCPGMGTH